MMDLQTLQKMNELATARAAKRGNKPYVIKSVEEMQDWERFPFPYVGDLELNDWELLDEPEPLFVDCTGWGTPGEAALTIAQFKEELKKLFEEDPSYGYAVIEAGQFQVHVGVFKEKGDATTKVKEQDAAR